MSLYDYSVENNEIKIFCVIVVGNRIILTSYLIGKCNIYLNSVMLFPSIKQTIRFFIRFSKYRLALVCLLWHFILLKVFINRFQITA